SFDCQHTGFSPKKQARGREVACENGKIASREAAGEKKQGKERKICAIFCKNVQKVLDGWTYHVVSSYLPVKEGFLFARFCFSARKGKAPLKFESREAIASFMPLLANGAE
ncbi:MAG: hypothetical protein UE630_02200, partial [Oscillospiraceae bacterium]|nr:hypothetical protein [Oscillospiraceae bacterium]